MRPLPLKPKSRGVTLVETTVALGLLITATSVTATLAVRNQRLLADNRVYRLAVEELSNRLETLIPLSADEAEAAIHDFHNEELSGPLAGAHLEGTVQQEDYGRRLSLTLTWPSAVKRRPDVSLSAWSFADKKPQGGQP